MLAVSQACLAAVAPRRHQLQVAAVVADSMDLVGIEIGVANDVALNRRCSQQPLGHDALVLITGSDAPGRDGPVRAANRVHFVAFSLALRGSAVTRLPILGAAADG